MTTKFSYSFHRIGRLGNEKHVRLRADDRSESLAEDRMILYAQDTNRLSLNHYNRVPLAIVMVCLSSGQSLDLTYKHLSPASFAPTLLRAPPRSVAEGRPEYAGGPEAGLHGSICCLNIGVPGCFRFRL